MCNSMTQCQTFWNFYIKSLFLRANQSTTRIMQVINYYNTKMKSWKAPLGPNSPQNMSGSQQRDKHRRQQLIVQINIGKQSQTHQIHLSDINNSNYINFKIRSFMKEHQLKEAAFSYIKEIIMKQISSRKEEIYRQSHSKCSINCKCHHKMHTFNMKEKKILGVITLNNNNPKAESKSSEKKSKISSSPLNISIKININKGDSRSIKKQAPSQPNNLKTQHIQQSKILTHQQETSSCNSLRQYFSIRNPQTTLQHSFTLNRQFPQTSISLRTGNNSQNSINVDTPTPKKSKLISTKERKEALMTPRRRKNTEIVAPDISLYNGQSLLQQSSRMMKKILESPLFPDKCVPAQFQVKIKRLFSKLTERNPAGVNELSSQYVSYQDLQRQQLQLMGILFEKIDYKELNNLNYDNFRQNTLKYCWKELQYLSLME